MPLTGLLQLTFSYLPEPQAQRSQHPRWAEPSHINHQWRKSPYTPIGWRGGSSQLKFTLSGYSSLWRADKIEQHLASLDVHPASSYKDTHGPKTAVWGHSGKSVICKPRAQSSEEAKCRHLDLELPPELQGSKFLLVSLVPSGVWTAKIPWKVPSGLKKKTRAQKLWEYR